MSAPNLEAHRCHLGGNIADLRCGNVATQVAPTQNIFDAYVRMNRDIGVAALPLWGGNIATLGWPHGTRSGTNMAPTCVARELSLRWPGEPRRSRWPFSAHVREAK